MSEIIRYHSNMSVINFTRLDENRRIRIYDSYRPALCVPFLSIIFYEIVKQIVLRDESHIAVRNMRCVSCMKDVRYMYIYIYIYICIFLLIFRFFENYLARNAISVAYSSRFHG